MKFSNCRKDSGRFSTSITARFESLSLGTEWNFLKKVFFQETVARNIFGGHASTQMKHLQNLSDSCPWIGNSVTAQTWVFLAREDFLSLDLWTHCPCSFDLSASVTDESTLYSVGARF